jgi:hypothetical protein
MRNLIVFSLALAVAAPAFAQNPPPAPPKNDLDPANDPAIRKEIDRVHEELANLLKQQTEALRSISPNAGIIPLKGIGNRVPCVGGSCAYSTYERLYGPGRTGLALLPLPPDIRAGLKIDDDTGVLVHNVFPDTPADIAGYRPGDVLIEFNNMKVPNDLSAFMGSAAYIKNGVPVHGTVIRGDKRLEMGEMRLTDQRVIPAPVMIGDLTPVAIIPRDQPVASNGKGNGNGYAKANGGGIQFISNQPDRLIGNTPPIANTRPIERYDGVRQVQKR